MKHRHPTTSSPLFLTIALVAVGLFARPAGAGPREFREDFRDAALPAWSRFPTNLRGVTAGNGKAVLQAEDWSYLLTKDARENVRAGLKFTVLEPARNFRAGGYGGDWNAYKYHAYDDLGYEVGILLRAHGAESGYRVQLSTRYQEVALLKYPTGSFLRVVPCALKVKQPYALEVSAQANEIVVTLDGKELLRYADPILPLKGGRFGIGTSSSARVAYEAVTLSDLPRKTPTAEQPHAPDFRVRNWRGRNWIFDGQEPILLLFTADQPYNQSVKLKPGFRPVLLWNADWGVSNGGEVKDAIVRLTEPKVEAQGRTLQLNWQGRNAPGIYATSTRLVIGYDPGRKMYTYDVNTSLEVFKEYHFRYGFDFEHHIPLGPFYSQYLVVKGHDGKLYYRPVYPIDPGPIADLAKQGGLRMWYGRTYEPIVVASPAVEYDISQAEQREASTAVCACMYDTGVGFPPETAKPGTRIAVHYRYTGYPPEEAERVFQASTVYPMRSIDPKRHLIFADYPRTTFQDFLPLDRPWWGKRPFTSGHNILPPHYTLETNTGFGNGHAIRLGPGDDCAASLPSPKGPLPAGRYVVSAFARAENLYGSGAYLEILATDQQLVHGYTGGDVRTSTRVLKRERHYLGNGSFDWKRVGFVTEVPSGAPAVAVALGNAGTGDVLLTELEVRPLKAGEKPPEGVTARAAPPSALPAAPNGAIADYRMGEGKGLFVFDAARGPLGMLQLANLDWVVDDGRPALKFADNPAGRKEYPRGGTLDTAYLGTPGYKGRDTVPVAIAGYHGGGFEVKAFTLAAAVKPAARMGAQRGDVVGLGARRFILCLNGAQAPYTLGAALNVGDQFTSEVRLEAGRWYHVALTGETTPNRRWRVRLYLDGRLVHEGVSRTMEAPATIPPSLILGAELFYLHDSYYRGLIGRTTVYDRALAAAEIAELARGFGK